MTTVPCTVTRYMFLIMPATPRTSLTKKSLLPFKPIMNYEKKHAKLKNIFLSKISNTTLRQSLIILLGRNITKFIT